MVAQAHVAGCVVVGRPLPDVADQVEDPEAVRRVRPDRCGAADALVVVREAAQPRVGLRNATGVRLIAPREPGAIHASAGRELVLGLRRQPLARPSRVRRGVLEGDVHHGMPHPVLDRGAGAERRPPERTGLPAPPVAPVAQVDRPGGRGEDHRAGHEVLGRDAGIVGGGHGTLGDRDVPGVGDETRVVLVRDLVAVDAERGDLPLDHGLLVGVELGGAHAERSAFDQDHLCAVGHAITVSAWMPGPSGPREAGRGRLGAC